MLDTVTFSYNKDLTKKVFGVHFFLYDSRYSKVPPLRNCIIRNSSLVLLNKIPVYKKLSRLIHVQFLLQWYIVIFYGIYLNMAPINLSSLEVRMKF